MLISLTIGLLALTPLQDGAAAAAPTTQEGPLRLEITAMNNSTFLWLTEPPANPPKSQLRMQFKLRGAGMKSITRASTNVIIEEMIDDQGNKLFDESMTPEERKGNRPVQVDDGMINQGGIIFIESFDSPNRAAQKLRSVKGRVEVFMAEGLEEISIDNPLQYADQMLDHPRLKELGIQVKIIGLPGADGSPDPRVVGVQTTTGQERVQVVEFYDDWMRVISTRGREQRTDAGESYIQHRAAAPNATFNKDTQMVLRVFAKLNTQTVRIDATDVALP